MRKFLGPIFLLSAAFCALSAHASGISGDTVALARYYPNTSTVDVDLGSQVIVATGTDFIHSKNAVITVSPDNISINFTVGNSASTADFNGFIFTDTSENFPAVYALDPGSSVSPFDYSTVGNKFYVNISGLVRNAGDTIAFTTVSPVPEPQTYALLVAGLSVLGLYLRKSKTRPDTGFKIVGAAPR